MFDDQLEIPTAVNQFRTARTTALQDHGPTDDYLNHTCRCRPCRQAAAAFDRVASAAGPFLRRTATWGRRVCRGGAYITLDEANSIAQETLCKAVLDDSLDPDVFCGKLTLRVRSAIQVEADKASGVSNSVGAANGNVVPSSGQHRYMSATSTVANHRDAPLEALELADAYEHACKLCLARHGPRCEAVARTWGILFVQGEPPTVRRITQIVNRTMGTVWSEGVIRLDKRDRVVPIVREVFEDRGVDPPPDSCNGDYY